MPRKENTITIFTEKEIMQRIIILRSQKVLLDRDLAELYGVKTQELNKAVNRNKERFPSDFMFKLDFKEYSNLIFQNGISSWGGRRHLPNAFSENGVAMLSSVLRSKKAIQINIQIMRIFSHLHHILVHAEDIHKQVKILGNQSAGHKMRIDVAFDAINFLLEDRRK